MSTLRSSPWRIHGLSDRQAAAHALDRLAFGARPGEVDRVLETGLARWLERQLDPDREESSPILRHGAFDLLEGRVEDVQDRFPGPQKIRAQAKAAMNGREPTPAQLAKFARQRGYRDPRELYAQLLDRKLLGALYAENQFQELLADFWFNHFNVSLTDRKCALYVPFYERDVIRPRVLGHFRDLVESAAKHPAMLFYLDNAQSAAGLGRRTTRAVRRAAKRSAAKRRASDPARRRADQSDGLRRLRGINENYARELLELHTLGVDGGYTQRDVKNAARALTGWTTFPTGLRRDEFIATIEAAIERDIGHVREGEFVFRADRHDAETKTVLGRTLPPGRGIEDGLELIERVSEHPSTAEHISTKLARRLVADSPPDGLVRRVAEVFLASRGDLRRLVEVVVLSEEFWDPRVVRQKIKSPFEVVVSALRAVGADVRETKDTARWVARMGQQLYSCRAPTGFPDRAEHWVNAGALLNRMNFGLTVAANRIRGVAVDLDRLDEGSKPESRRAALETYARRLLPEREFDTTPLLAPAESPDLVERLEREAANDKTANDKAANDKTTNDKATGDESAARSGSLDAQAQIIGVLLGSPEFQRK